MRLDNLGEKVLFTQQPWALVQPRAWDSRGGGPGARGHGCGKDVLGLKQAAVGWTKDARSDCLL